MWLPAIIHSLAFAVSLNVQAYSSPLAGIWLMLMLAGCAVLVRDGYPDKTKLWYSSLAWIITLFLSCFLLMPVENGAATLWVLSATPLLALCLHDKYFKPYLISFGIVIGLYAINLILQAILEVHYTGFGDDGHYGRAWPLIDPNNAACVINASLLFCFYLAIKGKPFADWLLLLFVTGLAMTRSRSGFIAAGAGCTVILALEYGLWVIAAAIVGFYALVAGSYFIHPEWILTAMNSFQARFPIWAIDWKLLLVSPWRGLGLGSFPYYYSQMRTEHDTGGWFAHNDFLQVAIEMGIPALLVFSYQWIRVALNACKKNSVSTAFILAVILQSSVEFQFYVPPVAMLIGVALACQSKSYA